MKKLISFISITILLLSLSVTVFAGSVPEDLLHYDGAHIFFGEVLSYTENGDVAVSPVKKIKGDIKTGTKQTYSNANAIGDIDIKPGNVYLITYFDENNSTDIFEVTSYDTKTLKLKNVEGDMWERFEKYLNDGEYEKAEQKELKERAAAIRAELSKAQEATVNAEKFMNVVRKYTSFEELTPTLLREFVEKIVVHECSYDENGTRRQDIDIYYSFVGKVDLPE